MRPLGITIDEFRMISTGAGCPQAGPVILFGPNSAGKTSVEKPQSRFSG